MNVLKLTPCVPPLASVPMPVPSTNRNRNGWISEVRIRRRSRLKRISSRFHTTRIARSSLRRLRAGTRTRATWWAGGPEEAGRTGEAVGDVVSVAISTTHHPRHVAAHVALARLLGVANRLTRIRHEHVVQRGPG